MTETMFKAEDGTLAALDKAIESGLDKNHLMYLLTLVATNKITDFCSEDIIEGDGGELELIVHNIPQYEAPMRHCQIAKIVEPEKVEA